MAIKTDNRPKENRMVWLDATKGFAAILVVLGHNLGAFEEQLIMSDAVLSEHLFNWIYSFHMFLFFCIFGYLFFRSYFQNNTVDRNKRFYIQLGNYCIIYLVFSIFFWLARFLLSNYTRIQVGWIDLIKIPLIRLEMLWFLWVLIVLFFVGFYILRFVEKYQSQYDFLWLFLAFIVSIVSQYLPSDGVLCGLNNAAFYSLAFFSWCIYPQTWVGFFTKTIRFPLSPDSFCRCHNRNLMPGMASISLFLRSRHWLRFCCQ